MIEVQDMAVQIFGAEEQVPQQIGIPGDGASYHSLYGVDRGQGMACMTDAADSLTNDPCIIGLFADQDVLESPVHGSSDHGILYLPTLDCGIDAEMALNAADRIYDYITHLGPGFTDSTLTKGASGKKGSVHPIQFEFVATHHELLSFQPLVLASQKLSSPLHPTYLRQGSLSPISFANRPARFWDCLGQPVHTVCPKKSRGLL